MIRHIIYPQIYIKIVVSIVRAIRQNHSLFEDEIHGTVISHGIPNEAPTYFAMKNHWRSQQQRLYNADITMAP